MKYVQGFALKKAYGQHFLRDNAILQRIINGVSVDKTDSILEIGCGDGALTSAILSLPIARLWVFEIDQDWIHVVKNKINDARMTIFHQNILDINPSILHEHAPWTLLANLPYNITFPILHLVLYNRSLFKEGIVMVQEEVAQKICKQKGRDYGFISLYMQHFFEWKLLDKVPPTAFTPPPKVNSRLLYFKPRVTLPTIQNEEEFWEFIKLCFKQPRRTIKNNLLYSVYANIPIDKETLELRAQALTFEQLYNIWLIILDHRNQ